MKGVAGTLLFAGKKLVRATPGKAKKRTLSPTRTCEKKPVVPKPSVDIHNRIHHRPEFGDKSNM